LRVAAIVGSRPLRTPLPQKQKRPQIPYQFLITSHYYSYTALGANLKPKRNFDSGTKRHCQNFFLALIAICTVQSAAQMAQNGKNRRAIFTILRVCRIDVNLAIKP